MSQNGGDTFLRVLITRITLSWGSMSGHGKLPSVLLVAPFETSEFRLKALRRGQDWTFLDEL